MPSWLKRWTRRPTVEGVVAEGLGDGGGRVALEGHQDHGQAQGEAEGTMEEGQEVGAIVDGGRCEDVRWGQTGGGLVVGLLRVVTRLPRSRRCTSPRPVAWPITRKISGTPLRDSARTFGQPDPMVALAVARAARREPDLSTAQLDGPALQWHWPRHELDPPGRLRHVAGGSPAPQPRRDPAGRRRGRWLRIARWRC